VTSRPRRGFTLLEMGIVLAIMAVSAMLVVPAISRMGQGKPPGTGEDVVRLLNDARKIAIERNETVTLRLDPASGRYRADTAGVAGSGELGEGTLSLGAQETLVTDLPRLVYVFHPTGAAFADTVLVRGTGAAALVRVDPWNGVAYAAAR
jgi:prepilin-type N-terminal cleavage/methylation domain-containing protein